MKIDKKDILQKVREIYLREIMMFEESELDNNADLGKMNGYKVASDDLSMFIRGVQTDFDIPILQSDCDHLFTLGDYCDFVAEKLNKKYTIPDIEP